jgi:hypothetical protein
MGTCFLAIIVAASAAVRLLVESFFTSVRLVDVAEVESFEVVVVLSALAHPSRQVKANKKAAFFM